MLLLTVFAAFKLYALLPGAAAFGLSVVLIAGLGVLAVAQDSRTLAVLGILAGFLAPMWLSTGSGNHVALFSYYAILNAAILAIAWWRPWRVLNLLGFVFTFGIGTAWGVLQYRAEKFASTEPFLLLFFAFYLLIPILYARKRPASQGDRIDGCLVFGTPLIAFSLQAGLLEGERMPLALCALAVAALYAVLAWLLIRRERYAVLGQSYALLARRLRHAGGAAGVVGAGHGLRVRARRRGAGLAGLAAAASLAAARPALGLQLAAAFAFVIGTQHGIQTLQADGEPDLHGRAAAGAGGLRQCLVLPARRRRRRSRTGVAARTTCGVSAGGARWRSSKSIASSIPTARADVLLAFVALTGWLAAEVHRRRPAKALVLTTLAAFVAAAPLALAQAGAHGQPFAGHGWWAWLVFAVLGVRSLWCLRARRRSLRGLGAVRLVAAVAIGGRLAVLACWPNASRWRKAGSWRWWRCHGLRSWPYRCYRWPLLAVPLGARFDGYRVPSCRRRISPCWPCGGCSHSPAPAIARRCRGCRC